MHRAYQWSVRYAPVIMLRQPSLLDRGPPGFDREFSGIRRIALDADAWIDELPGWVRGHERLFDELDRAARWREERRHMYDHIVDVPRLLASVPEDCPPHPAVEEMRSALGERYRQSFDFASLALYRDGRDSVAWHGDRVARTLPEALVAIVSLGSPRRFLIRPATGGKAVARNLGWGDLLVMGGSCQRTWRHAVPKVAAADPRLTIQFRPAWFASARY